MSIASVNNFYEPDALDTGYCCGAVALRGPNKYRRTVLVTNSTYPAPILVSGVPLRLLILKGILS